MEASSTTSRSQSSGFEHVMVDGSKFASKMRMSLPDNAHQIVINQGARTKPLGYRSRSSRRIDDEISSCRSQFSILCVDDFPGLRRPRNFLDPAADRNLYAQVRSRIGKRSIERGSAEIHAFPIALGLPLLGLVVARP
jgi:hypothetical protein